jgi:uncharacterized membrane protein YhaH (DUF805 family)
VNWYLDVLKNYVGFGGRARRKEYWMFFLVNLAVLIVLAIIDAVIKTTIPFMLYDLAVLLPSVAVGFRRLHDTGRSAWWLLIALVPLIGGIILLVFMATDSQPGTNQYGPNPKAIADAA